MEVKLRRIRIILFMLVPVFVVLNLKAQTDIVRGEFGPRLDSLLLAAEAGGFHGNVLVAQHGTVELLKGYGFANHETNTRFSPSTLVQIGSNVKDFTKAAVYQLVEQGRLRLTDPLEQHLLDNSQIQQVSVDDLRNATPAVFAQLDRLNAISDKIYIHIDMDVLDPREVMGHGNKVPDGPSSEQLARLFEMIFTRYPKASAIGFATIPSTDEGGLSIAALNRMIAGAVKGVIARERR